MAQDIEKVGEGVEEAVELQPIIEGLKKVAKFTSETAKSVDKKLSDTQADLEGKILAIEKKLTANHEAAERGVGDIVDRIEDLSKRASVFGKVSFEQSDASALREAVPERFLKNMGMYEQFKKNDGEVTSDPRYIAAKHAWFNLNSKLQLKNYQAEHEAIRAEMAKLEKTFDLISKADMGGTVDTSGGYAVPNIVGNEVFKIMRDASLIYSRARQFQMTSDSLSFPDEATAVSVGWHRTDGTTITVGEPVFGVKTLTANKLVGRAVFSLELLDDANVAILPFLQSCFAEQMGANLDAQAMEGTTPFTGVATATSVNDGVVTTNGTIGQTLTYASSTATFASLVRIFTKAQQGSVINGGTWVCGPGVYAKIIGLVDNNGQPIVRLGTVEGQPNNTLFGRPIIVSSALVATTLGAGTNSVGGLYYGQMGALAFGTRQGFRWDVSEHVSFATYQAQARMVGRFGYVVAVPTAWVRNLGIAIA